MFKRSLVIHAFPRTGSTLVRHNLSEYFNIDVEHNHDVLYIPQHSEYTAVVTRRRNVFDCVCSHLVMLHTGEMSIYSHKQFDKFDIDLKSFSSLVTAHEYFYQQIDLSCYRQVVDVGFEELISDPYYLFGKFNIVEKTSYGIEQSPNRYQQLVRNIDEVYTCYQSLINNTGGNL